MQDSRSEPRLALRISRTQKKNGNKSFATFCKRFDFEYFSIRRINQIQLRGNTSTVNKIWNAISFATKNLLSEINENRNANDLDIITKHAYGKQTQCAVWWKVSFHA
jgi:hypothetical protein